MFFGVFLVSVVLVVFGVSGFVKAFHILYIFVVE